MNRLLLTCLLTLICWISTPSAEIPATLSYQGILKDGDGVIVDDGGYQLTFRIYDVANGETALWTEVQTLPVADGVFNAILGSVTLLDLSFDEAYWLGVQVENDPELAPRVAITAAAYAMRAAVSEALAGPVPADEDWTIDGDDIFRLWGRVGIGSIPNDAPLHRDSAGDRTPQTAKVQIVGENEGLVSVMNESDGDSNERAAVYAKRVSQLNNPGDGFGVMHSNNAVTGYNEWGDSYSFGVAGYTWFDDPHTAGVLGAYHNGDVWAALGYNDPDGFAWGLYTNSNSYVGGELTTLGFRMPVAASPGHVLTCDGVGLASWQPLPADNDADWVIIGDDMYAGNAGDVGIGITTPLHPLHIRQEVDWGISYALKLDNPSNVGTSATGILFKTDAGDGDRGKGGLVYEWSGTWNRGDFLFLQNSSVGTAQASLNDAVMAIKNSGNVGIGTVDPAEKLQVNGVIYSTSGGIKFPDGTVQTTASGGGGEGLTLPYAGEANSSGPAFAVRNYGSGDAVYGEAYYNNAAGLRGYNAGSGEGVFGTAATNGTGVYGICLAGTGVHGESQSSYGIRGESSTSHALHGQSATGTAIYGTTGSSASYAVTGVNSGAGTTGRVGGANGGIEAEHATTYAYLGGANNAVYGEQTASSGYGVQGYAEGDDAAAVRGWYDADVQTVVGELGTRMLSGHTVGVYGHGLDENEYAGYFTGDVGINGFISKNGGSFKIDHPLDPTGKYLYHSFVESPDMMNIYNGNVLLDTKGEAWVMMPEWFEALNMEFRYQLTAIGGAAPNLHVAQKIADNRFKIAGGPTGLEVSWMVTGIRQDPIAEQNRIPVEEAKPASELGKYLHPKAYGMPKEMGVDYNPRFGNKDGAISGD